MILTNIHGINTLKLSFYTLTVKLDNVPWFTSLSYIRVNWATNCTCTVVSYTEIQ